MSERGLFMTTEKLSGRLLLVEDDHDAADMFTIFVRRSGLEVHTVHEGEEALECLRQTPYDLVLSDIVLPGMSGIKLLARAQASGLRSPFVFLTGYGNSDLVIEAVRLGAIDFLCKPVRESDLIAVLGRALAISLRQQEIHQLLEALGESPSIAQIEKIQDLERQLAMLRVLSHSDGEARQKKGA